MEIEISEDGFINMLQAQNGGALVGDLDREMIKGLQACWDHGGKSVITLKITMSRTAGMDIAANIVPDLTAKHPKEPLMGSTMFVTKGSGLSSHYQEQEALDLGVPTEPVKPSLVPHIGNKE